MADARASVGAGVDAGPGPGVVPGLAAGAPSGATAEAKPGAAVDRPGMGALLSRLRARLLLRLLVPLVGLIVLDALLAYRAQQYLSEGLLGQAAGPAGWVLLETLLPHLIILVTLAVAAWQAVDAALRPLLDLVAGQAEHQRRFIADAAHQLRTPLAALQSQVEAWAQAARRIVPPGTTGSLLVPVDQIDKLCGATRRTTQLANQLLALSRAEARTTTDQAPEPVDLKALSESVLEAYLDKALAKRIDLGLEVEPVSVLGHTWLLREYLANVVDNAVKYTPAGGTVTIRGGPVIGHADGSGVGPGGGRGSAGGAAVGPGRSGVYPGGAFLTVEDDGPGVPVQDLPRVLDRFYRVPGSTAEGTGLGLAIADEIARVHRARLVLGPGAAGRGLSVSLVFPGKNRR